MNLFASGLGRIKLGVLLIAVLVAVIGFGGYYANYDRASASASGPTPGHTNAPGEANCTACHSDYPINSGSGMVELNGVPATYSPGQQIPLTVRVSQVDGVIYGFQMTAIDNLGRAAGTYTLPVPSPTPTPQRLQVLTGIINNVERSYIEHTIDGINPSGFGSHQWNFTWNAPPNVVGRVRFYVTGNAADSDQTPSNDFIYSTSKTAFSRAAVPRFDFDGDGLTDVGIYRPTPAEWWYLRSSDGAAWATQFGALGDVPVPVDFTGDSRADIAFFRPTTGQWFVLRSEDFSFYSFPFGSSGDIASPADFDGDGKSDAAVYRPSASTWFISRSSDGGTTFTQFGIPADLPVPADYDGDGRADVGVWRSGPGEWWIQRSSAGLLALQFGANGDNAVTGDYTGDGKADVAVWRPSNGFWYVLRSENFSFFAFPFGTMGDLPVPGDYDGDGRTDAAVFRQPGAVWFALRSTAGPMTVAFGAGGDQPLSGSFVR